MTNGKTQIQRLYPFIDQKYVDDCERIRRAIRAGQEFFIDTFLGKLKVDGITIAGHYAITELGKRGERAWAICSDHVNRWTQEIEGGN